MSRQWGGETYLFKTLDSLLTNTLVADMQIIVIVVFVSDFRADWNRKTSLDISRRYPQLCGNGTIQIVNVPFGIYPDFSQMKRTKADSVERIIWRSKQNIDFAFMMMYSRTLSRYYMQLEDDVISANNYFRDIQNFIHNQKVNWVCLEVSYLGFIGKIFKTVDIPKFASFFLTFYDLKPSDLLIGRVYAFLGQSKPIHSNVSLFQHIGRVSSLRHKMMPAVDTKFKSIGKAKLSIADIPRGDNPDAIIDTNMAATDDRKPMDPYVNQNASFKVKAPRKGDYYRIIYNKPMLIRRIIFSTGDDRSKSLTLVYGEVHVGMFRNGVVPCSNAKKIGPFQDGDFDSFLQGVKIPRFTNCIAIKVYRPQKVPCIIRRISVFVRK